MKALISHLINEKFELVSGIETIPLMPYYKLAAPVSTHADMLFCVLDDKIFCYEDYVKENHLNGIFENLGYEVIYVSNICESVYPRDISVNVLAMGKSIFCNQRNTAKEILDYASENNYKIINVKQGYSACSTLCLTENCAITSDEGMANALTSVGKDVLLVSNSQIFLEGYNCGFWGGASGVYGKVVYFSGDLTIHSDFEQIKSFIFSQGFDYKCITDKRICDFGGFKII